MSGGAAVLLGASGLVGRFCLKAVLASHNYARISLLNRRQQPPLPDPRVTQRVIDFGTLRGTDFDEADDVFCALGTTIRKAGSEEAFRRVDLEYPLAAAKAALLAGAKQFMLVSSVGANMASKNFYLRTKGELEQEITKLGFTAVHIFRPSLLLGKREEFRLGERIAVTAMPFFNFAMMGGLRRYRAIHATTVGTAMVAAAGLGKTGGFVHEYDEIVALAAR